jgi:hypothetical protein
VSVSVINIGLPLGPRSAAPRAPPSWQGDRRAAVVSAPVSAAELRTLDRCFDEAVAAAVTQYLRLREQAIADEPGQGCVFTIDLPRFPAATAV